MLDKPEDKFIKILTQSYCKLTDIVGLENARELPMELDLGCGKGSFTTRLAKLFPEKTILAADVMIGRLRKLQKRNMRENVNNIIPLRVEARHLLASIIGDEMLERVHLLCPDPWPKDRHRGNRLMCSDFLMQINRVLKKNGVFHFSSDDEPYFETVCRIMDKTPLFTRDDSKLADISGIKSDFEIRWNEQGKKVHHVAWIKNKAF